MTEFMAVTNNQEGFASKKAFKEAVEQQDFLMTNRRVDDIYHPVVVFENTLDMENYLASGETIQVTGPDPRTNRKWYANVEVRNGKIVVK